MVVVGIKESAGTYEGNSYHNINLHCLVPALDKGSLGQLAEIVKIKFEAVNSIFGKEMTKEDWNNLIGATIKCGYDKYGRCESVSVIKAEK